MIIRREMTWAQIQAAAAAGTLISGDRIAVELTTGEVIDLEIAYDQNGQCFFVTHDCLNELRPMNTTDTNDGGWPNTDLRDKLNGEVFDSLPDDLQTIIVETPITQIIDGTEVSCNDKLFCLSYTQVFGNDWTDINEREPYDSQLDIFTDGDSRVKTLGDNGKVWWWLRLPLESTKRFMYVAPIGDTGYISASSKGGVVFGFRLMPPENNG